MAGKGDLIADFIRKHNVRVFLEMGVYKGKMIGYIMKQASDVLEEYWAIDKWEYCEDYLKRSKPVDEEGWKNIKWWAYKTAGKWPKTVSVVNMHSADAATLFRDGYFDFIFIDAEHTYEPMMEYIRDWLPKTKKGRIFGGHDYDKKGVKKAVDEVFGEENVTEMEYGCWYVIP